MGRIHTVDAQRDDFLCWNGAENHLRFHPLSPIKAYEQCISGILHLRVLGLDSLWGAKAAVDSTGLHSSPPNSTTQQQSRISECWSRFSCWGQWSQLSSGVLYPKIQAGYKTSHGVRMWSLQRMSPSWWASAGGQQPQHLQQPTQLTAPQGDWDL